MREASNEAEYDVECPVPPDGCGGAGQYLVRDGECALSHTCERCNGTGEVEDED